MPKHSPATGSGFEAVVTDRRRAPRVGVLGRIEGRILDLGLTVVVLDVATGGVGVVAQEPLEVGRVHTVSLTSRAGGAAEIRARVANCRPASSPSGGAYFVAGLEVLSPSPSLDQLVDELIVAGPSD